MTKAATHSRKVSASKVLLLASASLAVIAAFCPASAIPATDFLSFTTTGNGFAGWTTYGTTSGSSATLKTLSTTDLVTLGDGVNGDKIKRPYSLTPATGQSMARIATYNNSSSPTYSLKGSESRFGLASGTFTTVFSGLASEGAPTNFGALTETITLAAGNYTFYWAYAAQDYHPYNDGVLFTLAGNGINRVDVLADNGNDSGGGGVQADTVVVGTFGATQWTAHTFSIDTAGTYQVSFAAYNWGPTNHPSDRTVDPLLYIGAAAGTVTQNTSSPIDANATYYLASNLGTSVTPDFKGGTLRIDASGVISSTFTVQTYSGNTIDAYGNIGNFSGVLSGSGGLTIKDSIGGGRIAFVGTASYIGGTTINTGATLQIGNGGTTGSISGNITDNGTLIFNRSNSITYASVISGSGALMQAGSGTLILTGTNTYTGGTTISAGTLQIGNGGTSGSITGDITNNAALTFNRSDVITYAGTISGTGSLTQAGTGTLILTGTNTYSGGTMISAGTLQIGDGNTSGSITGDITNNTELMFYRSDAVTYAGAISGTGSLRQVGSGTLLLTGANTYTGGTTIAAGTLQIGDGNTSGSITGDVLNNGALVFNRSDTVTYAGAISSSGSLTQAGTGTLILTGENTYSGGTTVSAGTLQIGNEGTSGSVTGNIVNNAALAFNHSISVTYAGEISGTGTLTQAGSGTLILTGTNTYSGGTTIAAGTLLIGNGGTTGAITGNVVNNGALVFNRGDTTVYGGVISGVGSMSVRGGSTLVLTGNNTYTGQTSVSSGTTLQLGDGGTTGSISGNVVNQGILAFNRSDTVAFNGNVTGDGALVQNGTGKVIITTNYTGKTIVNSGTLQIGDGGTTGAISGDITNNAALIFNRSDAVTYAGVISGSGRLTQAGTGTLILTGDNTYTGGTTIADGATLQLGNGGVGGSVVGNVINNGSLIYNRSNVAAFNEAISGSGSLHIVSGALALTGNNTYSGSTTVDSGARLQVGLSGATGSVTGNVVNNGTIVFARNNTLSYGGVISGTGSVTVNSGTVVLTGNSTYTGQTSIASGSTLQLGNGGTTGSIASNVVNHGILAFNHSDTVVFNGNVTGDGTMVQNGTGKVIVTTNYTGKSIVNSGVLQIGNGSTSGTVTGNIVNNGTVVYGQIAVTTYTGVISGSGGVAVAGGGVVILNGANTYTGPTTVTAGSLIIGDVMHPGSGVVGGVTVSNNAIIGGYGTIGGNLVATGGTVSPGNSIGTLTVAGNYAPNSAATLKIEVSPTDSDKLIVGGKAQLDGTLALSLQSGTYGTSLYSILTAGSISGTFSSVTYSGGDASMVYGVVYGAQEVDLAMTPKSSGQIYGDIVTQTLDTVEELNDATIDRLNTTTATGWSAWSKALSGASHTEGNAGLADFNSQLWGVISGADYQFSQGSKVSGVFSYTRNQLGVHGEGDKASVEGYFFALAGHVPANDFAFDVTGFVQHNIVDTVRSKGGVGNATGSTSNLVGGGSVQASYSVGDLRPFTRLTVATIGTESFKETGALGLAVGSQTLTSVRGSVGLEASHLFVTENGTRLLPHFMIGMEDEFGDTGRDTAITFTTTDFMAPAPSPTRYSALFGAGLTATLENKLELSLETRGRISANQYSGTLSVGAKYKF